MDREHRLTCGHVPRPFRGLLCRGQGRPAHLYPGPATRGGEVQYPRFHRRTWVLQDEHRERAEGRGETPRRLCERAGTRRPSIGGTHGKGGGSEEGRKEDPGDRRGPEARPAISGGEGEALPPPGENHARGSVRGRSAASLE